MWGSVPMGNREAAETLLNGQGRQALLGDEAGLPAGLDPGGLRLSMGRRVGSPTESLGRGWSQRLARTEDSHSRCVSRTILVRGTWSWSGGRGPSIVGSQASASAPGVLTGAPHPDCGSRERGREGGGLPAEIQRTSSSLATGAAAVAEGRLCRHVPGSRGWVPIRVGTLRMPVTTGGLKMKPTK